MPGVRAKAKCYLTAMRTIVSTSQSGLVKWLRACPERDWFVEIELGSTGGLDAWQETAYLFGSPANVRRLLDAAEAAERGETAEYQLDWE